MAFVLAAAAAAFLVQPVCSWDRPGVDRYRGTPAAALAHYRDISEAERATLARRIDAGIPDDKVEISRTSVTGHYTYAGTISDMHFDKTRLCRTVTRSQWQPAHRETAAVYCVGEACVLVPEVCGNVSRVRRIVTSGGSAPGTTGGAPPLPAQPPESPPQPAPVYPAVPSGSEALPPWAAPVAPLAPPPRLGYPGPGREVGMPVPLAPIPEPSTWAMLLGGLALVAARAGRRRGK
ncbi:MHFG family PEP-CTERM protein [Massilia sp. METH4]|uniref:MHFG family PEP-CTERM protein n=1 Tax=Massilia sp. METH4 TaxID=3123041 RepID=UPI0030D04B05